MDKVFDSLHWEEVIRKKFSIDIKENTKDPKEAKHHKSQSVSKRQVEEVKI